MEPETFLRAAVQGKMNVIEKFLADGGSPDTCDEVAPLAATGGPLLCRATKSCSRAPPCLGARAGTLGAGLEVQPDWAGEDESVCPWATVSVRSSTAQPCTAPRWRDTWKSCRSCWTAGPLLTSETG